MSDARRSWLIVRDWWQDRHPGSYTLKNKVRVAMLTVLMREHMGPGK